MKQFIKAMLISGMVFAGATCVCAANKVPVGEQITKQNIEKSDLPTKKSFSAEDINSIPKFVVKGKESKIVDPKMKKKMFIYSPNTLEKDVPQKAEIGKEEGASKSIIDQVPNEKPSFEVNTKEQYK